MKHTRRKKSGFVALLLLSLFLPTQLAVAEDVNGTYIKVDDCTYCIISNDNKEVVLTSWGKQLGDDGHAVIPDKITGPAPYNHEYTVVGLAAHNTKLKDNIEYSRNNLELVEQFPVGVFESVGASLKKITFPKNILAIDYSLTLSGNTFECKHQEYTSDEHYSVSVNMLNKATSDVELVFENNTNFKVVNNVLFSPDGKILWLYGNRITGKEYIVPDGVEDIYQAAFAFSNIEKIQFYQSIKNIGNHAFLNCLRLSDINFPTDGEINICTGAFSRTLGLTNITLPASIKTIHQYAFNSSRLEKVDIPGSVSTIGEEAFFGCAWLTSVKLNNGTEYIDKKAFAACRLLNAVEFPEGLKTISAYSFSSCPSLIEANLPSSVTTIGVSAFAFDYRLKKINIPAGATLGARALLDCESIETITVDGGTRYEMNNDEGKLDKGVLYGNSNSVEGMRDELIFFIPTNNIGADNKNLIRQWIVPASVKKICGGAFGKTWLESLVLPSNLETIEDLAFFTSLNINLYETTASTTNFPIIPKTEFTNAERSYITDLTIPAKVKSVYLNAFRSFNKNETYTVQTSNVKNLFFMCDPSVVSNTFTSYDYYSVSGLYSLSKNKIGINVYVKNSKHEAFKTKIGSYVNSVEYKIPLEGRLTGEGKVITMSRDFDCYFPTEGNSAKAYIATGIEWESEYSDKYSWRMDATNYIPSRTGVNADKYHGFVVRHIGGDDAPYYQIGELDYSLQSNYASGTTAGRVQTEGNYYPTGSTQGNLFEPQDAKYPNRLVGVVVNSHIFGTEGEGENALTNWGLSNGTWMRIKNTGRLTPYNRAYLQPTKKDTKFMLGLTVTEQMTMKFRDGTDDDDSGDTTLITTIEGESSTTLNDAWYTLNGSRLAGRPTQKGIYIHNNRK